MVNAVVERIYLAMEATVQKVVLSIRKKNIFPFKKSGKSLFWVGWKMKLNALVYGYQAIRSKWQFFRELARGRKKRFYKFRAHTRRLTTAESIIYLHFFFILRLSKTKQKCPVRLIIHVMKLYSDHIRFAWSQFLWIRINNCIPFAIQR